MSAPNLVPLEFHEAPEGAEAAAIAFRERLRTRRSVRDFSDRPVSRETLQALVAAAASAPSGANKQPWRFVAVSDPALKREIRLAAEKEERLFYEKRASTEWLRDLAHLGTDSTKPFLETAPWLVVLFKCMKDDRPERDSDLVYYVNESVGIAAGFLIAAIHHAGLATLTHTPSPMAFLQKLLRRPEHERAFLLLPIGYPAKDAKVPAIVRKPLEEVLVFDRPDEPPPSE